MYINPEVVGVSFLRLGETEPKAKRGVERTSGVFRFLAVDRLCKKHGEPSVLFDPDTGLGKENRHLLVSLYREMALVKTNNNRTEWVIDNIGSVNTDCSRNCEERIGNDFLTTPLKTASLSAEQKPYPRRPKPLLYLGGNVHGKPWGICKHPDWPANIQLFLDDRKSTTPWTDLAVILSRNTEFVQDSEIIDALTGHITYAFSEEVATWWGRKLKSEYKHFSKHMPCKIFVNEHINELEKKKYAKERRLNKDQLISHLREENLTLRSRLRELEDINEQSNC